MNAFAQSFRQIFEQRIRGFRLIDLIGCALVLAIIFWVCVSKAREDQDKQRMSQIDQQIAEQQQVVDGLKIKVARLESPTRLEALATTVLNMKPVENGHEAGLDSLPEISGRVSPAMTSHPVVAPAPAAVAPAAPAKDDLITTAAPASAKPATPAKVMP